MAKDTDKNTDNKTNDDGDKSKSCGLGKVIVKTAVKAVIFSAIGLPSID